MPQKITARSRRVRRPRNCRPVLSLAPRAPNAAIIRHPLGSPPKRRRRRSGAAREPPPARARRPRPRRGRAIRGTVDSGRPAIDVRAGASPPTASLTSGRDSTRVRVCRPPVVHLVRGREVVGIVTGTFSLCIFHFSSVASPSRWAIASTPRVRARRARSTRT